MKTILSTIAIATGLSLSQSIQAAEFAGREFSVSLFGGYIDKEGDSDVAPGAGISYFFTRHIGVGAFTHWENWEGTFIDNLSAEAHFRLPLDRLNLAPYGLAAFGYSFETEESFGAIGAGAEFRFNDKWGAFGDLRWQINDDTDDGVAVRLGVRLVL